MYSLYSTLRTIAVFGLAFAIGCAQTPPTTPAKTPPEPPATQNETHTKKSATTPILKLKPVSEITTAEEFINSGFSLFEQLEIVLKTIRDKKTAKAARPILIELGESANSHLNLIEKTEMLSKLDKYLASASNDKKFGVNYTRIISKVNMQTQRCMKNKEINEVIEDILQIIDKTFNLGDQIIHANSASHKSQQPQLHSQNQFQLK